MIQPIGRKSKPAPRSRFLVQARRTLAVLLLLLLDALVWGFMLQRLAARVNALRNPPPGYSQRLDPPGVGTKQGPLPVDILDLSFTSPRGGRRVTI